MKEKKSNPAATLAALAEKHQFEEMLTCGPRNGTKERRDYNARHVGEVVLGQRPSALGGLLLGPSPLADLKSDDIKDKGLNFRPEAPIKRKRSRVYKLSK